jgi:hypothetical protein
MGPRVFFCICLGCGQSLGPRCDDAKGFLGDRATLHGCVVRCRWRIGGDRITPGPLVDTGRRQQPLQGPPDGALVEPLWSPCGALVEPATPAAGQRPQGPSWVAPWVASWRWEFTIERVGFRLGSGADLHLDTLTFFAGVSSRPASVKTAACTFYGPEGIVCLLWSLPSGEVPHIAPLSITINAGGSSIATEEQPN